MISLLGDENFTQSILDGLLRENPDLDIVRVRDVGLSAQDDPAILAWAAINSRVVLTHDRTTMTRYAYDRIRAGLPMPGVIEVRYSARIGQLVEDLLLLIECSLPGEMDS